LKVGDPAPDFTLLDQDGRPFSLSQALQSQAVVLYFYPKDETFGCTKEACHFRDSFEAFVDIGATVVGVSADSVDSHRQFIANRKLPFTLLSDPDKVVHRQYGVGTGLLGILNRRLTFVIDRQGIIRSRFDSSVDFKGHVTASLKALSKRFTPFHHSQFNLTRRSIPTFLPGTKTWRK
jgi:thioredoxin-dependent peroxiredoxin